MKEMNDDMNDYNKVDVERKAPQKLYKVYSRLTKEDYLVVKEALSSHSLPLDKDMEVDGMYLIVFTMYRQPGESILTCSKSEWIVDEYREIESLDGTGSGEFKFEKAIFYRCNSKNIPLSQTFDNFDSLIQLYPVHYGEIRIKELNREIECLKEKITKIEHKISLPKFKESDKNSKQRWLTDLAILKNKMNTNLDEIRFIKDLWEVLNKEMYGYNDRNLSLRYHGIDVLSPLTNL